MKKKKMETLPGLSDQPNASITLYSTALPACFEAYAKAKHTN